MSGGYVGEALVFLLNTLFGLYLVIVALRFLLAWVRADFYNPISQFVVTVTNPPVRILRRVIPGFAGVDWSTLVLLLLLKILQLCVVGLVAAGRVPAPAGLLVLSVAELLRLGIYIFLAAIIIQVIISWVNPGVYNPVTVLLYRLTEPLLQPVRRLLPPVAGLDFSPLLVIIGLQLLVILVIKPLTHWGYTLGGFLP